MKQNEDIVSKLAIITHLTGASNYSWVHFRDRPRLLVSKSLTYFESLLPTCVRIHKTALVNPAYIQHIKPPLRAKTPGSVTMLGGDSLPISRRRWQEVADALQISELFIQPDDQAKSVTTTSGDQHIEGQVGRIRRGDNSGQPRFVYAFMQDERKNQLLAKLMSDKFPQYTVQFFDNGSRLTNQIVRTKADELPALVFLEGRNVGWALQNVLEFIKADSRYRPIPVVVFIRDSSGNDVEICYASGANSVVCQSSYGAFTEAAEQICTYWLTFAALPVN